MKHPLSVIVATFGDQEWHDLAWSRAFPSIRGQTRKSVVVHREHGPIEDVRNEAAAGVTGEWLCFLDADDELAPGFVAAMERAIRDGDRKRLLAPFVQFVKPGAREGVPGLPSARSTMPPLNHCVCATVISRELFELAGGFNSDYWPWSDYELWLRASRRGARVVVVPDAVYRYHVNLDGDNARLTRAQGQELGGRIHREHRAARGKWPIDGGEPYA